MLDVICNEDSQVEGDFWREQTVVKLPKPQDIRPKSFLSLADSNALKGKRFGVPQQYIGKDTSSGIHVRPSIVTLWEKAASQLTEAGAELVATNFPLVELYEADGLRNKPPYFSDEIYELERYAYFGLGLNRWLTLNDPSTKLSDFDPAKLFPAPSGSLEDQDFGAQYDYAKVIKEGMRWPSFAATPGFAEFLKLLEQVRKTNFEDWLAAENLDGIVFPCAADVGKADSDINAESAAHAWQPGVFFSNGNRALRQHGVPTASTCMGIMADINMPGEFPFKY